MAEAGQRGDAANVERNELTDDEPFQLTERDAEAVRAVEKSGAARPTVELEDGDMVEELTDDYRQHLLDLCDGTDLTSDFSAWKLAQEAKAAIPLLVAEVRRLSGEVERLYDESDHERCEG